MAVLAKHYKVKLRQGDSKGEEHRYLHAQVTAIPTVASNLQGHNTAGDEQVDKISKTRNTEGLQTIMKDMDTVFDN